MKLKDHYYYGSIENFEAHGYGYKKFATGESYIGEFDKNTREGYGKFTWVNGDVYIGIGKIIIQMVKELILLTMVQNKLANGNLEN